MTPPNPASGDHDYDGEAFGGNGHAASEQEERQTVKILRSLRQIMRAADLHSRHLLKSHRITAPQLVCLRRLVEQDGLSVSQLSRAVFLSPSTVVGILDRLERQGLVQRVRAADDRRRVDIHATEAGRQLVADAPLPLEQALEEGLEQLDAEQQAAMARSLPRLAEILMREKLAGPAVTPDHLAAVEDEAADHPDLPTESA